MKPTVYSYLRFSTPEQLKGDSLRRQLERSHQWCKENGYTLDESLTMQDLGLSAYSGAHKAKGALGVFLKAVEAGTIQPGSILIVESLDRLSRQDVVDAQTQFLNIINAGIEIVTLMDGYRYSRESIRDNWTQLIISLTIMSRAHEESKTKADRSKSAWQNKRKNADKRKLTATGPGWLKLNKKTQVFEPIPEHVGTVQRIFKDYLDGHGAYVITRRLNDDGVSTIGPAKKWGVSTVKMILHNRSVLGEFQPHHRELVNGKTRRVPEGPPIKNYYPKIVTDDAFNAVQARMAKKVKKGGRIGFVGNLFQHILYCGACGSKYGYTKKQGGKYQYLRCGNRHAGRGCDSTPWPYPDFESAFLNECQELDIAAILPNGNGRAKKIKDAQQDMDACQGELADLDKRIVNMEKTIELAESEAVIAMFIPKLDNALAEKKDGEKRLSEATMVLHAAQSETTNVDEQLKSLQDLIHKLEKATGDDLIALRSKLKNAIAQLVERIDVFSDGMRDSIVIGDAMTGWRLSSIQDEIDPVEGEAIIADYIERNTGKVARAFLIRFRAGGFRLLKLHGDMYRTKQASTREGIEKVLNEGAAA